MSLQKNALKVMKINLRLSGFGHVEWNRASHFAVFVAFLCLSRASHFDVFVAFLCLSRGNRGSFHVNCYDKKETLTVRVCGLQMQV
jgi:hypothetical protein